MQIRRGGDRLLPLRFEHLHQEWEWRTAVVERRREGNNNVYPYNNNNNRHSGTILAMHAGPQMPRLQQSSWLFNVRSLTIWQSLAK